MTPDEQKNLEKHIKEIKCRLRKKGIDENVKGAVFYSGYKTLFNNYGVYLIGANPGGSPEEIPGNIGESLAEFAQHPKNNLNFTKNSTNEHDICSDMCIIDCEKCKKQKKEYYEGYYNSYLDECWGKKCKNKFQKNIKDAFERLDLDLRATCGSNLVFERSKRKSEIKNKFSYYIEVHNYIINNIINPNAIIAFDSDVYGILEKNWQEKGEPLRLNPDLKDQRGAPRYIQSIDKTKILCYVPHFSSGWYSKFKNCPAERHQKLSTLIKELCRNRKSRELPKWNFGLPADDAGVADDCPVQAK